MPDAWLSMIPDTVLQLLHCLSDGQVHSGEELGRRLGITRAAVWKQVRSAREWGVPLHARRGNGYALADGFALLDAGQIGSQLDISTRQTLQSLEVLPGVDSTNAVMLAALREQVKPAPWVLLAEQQSAGRGRRGRVWVSPFGRNIYLTLGWEYPGGIQALEGLSLVVGLQVLQTLQALGNEGLQLKWPNDVLWQGRKLAGILIEVQGDPEGHCQVAVGIGINMQMETALATAINQPWVDVRSILEACHAPAVSRNAVVAALLNRLVPVMQALPAQGFVAFQQAWQQHDCCVGKIVSIESGNQLHQGNAVGVNAHGAYGILPPGAPHPVYYSGGEISLRVPGKAGSP